MSIAVSQSIPPPLYPLGNSQFACYICNSISVLQISSLCSFKFAFTFETLARVTWRITYHMLELLVTQDHPCLQRLRRREEGSPDRVSWVWVGEGGSSMRDRVHVGKKNQSQEGQRREHRPQALCLTLARKKYLMQNLRTLCFSHTY